MSAFDGFDQHETLVAELRANAPVAPERLRERVLSASPARRARRLRLPRRRLVLVVVPVAVALAVGAALVHGFVSSGSKQPLRAAGVHKLSPLPSHITHGGAAANGAATTTPNAYEAAPLKPGKPHANLSQAATADQMHGALVIPKNRLVQADASLQVQVPSHAALTHATNRATQIVSSLGGYAQSVQYQSSRQGYGNAYLALRLPLQKAQTAIARLGSLGRLVSQQVSTRDLQHQLTRQTNRIGSLRRAIAVYEQALQSGMLSASQRVEIEIKLANARHAITEVRKARSGTVASGATADVSLTLTTHKSGAVGGGHHKSGRFGRLLGSAGHFLALEGIIVLYALVVVSPLLVLAGLAWWVLRERRRREERLLASSA